MKLSRADVELYSRRKLPAWALPIADKMSQVSVHDCINARASQRSDLVKHNTLVLLRLARKNGEQFPAYLRYLERSCHTEEKRRAFVRRLLKHFKE